MEPTAGDLVIPVTAMPTDLNPGTFTSVVLDAADRPCPVGALAQVV